VLNTANQFQGTVPPFIKVDGVAFPLGSDRWGVWIVQDARLPGLRPLSYVVAHLTSQRLGPDRLAELVQRKSFTLQMRLTASVVNEHNRAELGDGVANWTRLAGHPPDLDDAYLIGTPFLTEVLVVPRPTLIHLVERLGALHDTVLTRTR
jgi:hypothetical protein